MDDAGDDRRSYTTLADIDPDASTDSQVVVPIYEGAERGVRSNSPSSRCHLTLVWAVYTSRLVNDRFVSLTSFLVFYLYLGKMLKQLDPSQAIPDRVRTALDTMAEGLLVMDAKQNIVLANLAFVSLSTNPRTL